MLLKWLDSNFNRNQTHNRLVNKITRDHLAKLISLLLLYFSAQPGFRDILPEPCNIITREHLFIEEWYHKNLFHFYFVAVFVVFAPSCCFSAFAVFACMRSCDTNNFNKISRTKMYHYTITKSSYVYTTWKLVGQLP